MFKYFVWIAEFAYRYLQVHFKGVSCLILFPLFATFVVLTPAANLPLVSLTPVVHLDLRISTRIFVKILNDPNVIIIGMGEYIHEKNIKKKSRDTVPLIG